MDLAERLRFKAGELPHGTDVCKCPVCGLLFASAYAFDFHRVGRHDPDERRCLDVAAMSKKGMGINRHGRWVSKLKLDENMREF